MAKFKVTYALGDAGDEITENISFHVPAGEKLDQYVELIETLAFEQATRRGYVGPDELRLIGVYDAETGELVPYPL